MEAYMKFSERMKGVVEQSAAVSREFAARAGEKAQEWGEKGVEATKKFAGRAGAKAQDLGERGVLMLDIKQLEGQASKLVGRLGTEAYHAFVEKGVKSISVDTPAVKTILAELASVRELIEKREKELTARRKG
jgi:capsule polysaccharide export protein KpsE/RkpR